MARRSFLTTFEVSQICEVNPTTVQNWVKEKKLKAHLTPGGHRRIRREDLIEFLREFGMPIPEGFNNSDRFVLIVDDESEVMELLKSMFEIAGEQIAIDGVQNGVDALLRIGERKPDLLILDIMLPGMNGIEVCRKLKTAPTTRNIKIIAISGDHDPSLRDRIMSAGADRFVTKPFDLLTLRSECLHLLQLPEER